jgi:hypothetical protein
MDLAAVDITTKNTLAARYSVNGLLVIEEVDLPPTFEPSATDVIFLDVGGNCEVYIDARVAYAGADRRWQALMLRAEAPGHARFVATSVDFFSALRTLVQMLATLEHDNTPTPQRDERRAWLQKLGLSGNPTVKQIKKAYRRLAMVYHPDRLVGAPLAEINAAEDRFKGIAEAHHGLLSLR